jgi:FlaA1/EpsC-like NDP-sugar epimerase
MTRYFMLIPEAVSLILQTGAMAGSSYGTYVLEMGRPVRIAELAQKMIEVMGAEGVVEVKFVGLRPGERLHEALYEEGERRAATGHPMVFRLAPKGPPPPDLLEAAEEMAFFALAGEEEKALALLRRAVPNYCPPAVESGPLPEAL